MKKNMSWKFTDESSVTFQLSVSGAGEFGLKPNTYFMELPIVLKAPNFNVPKPYPTYPSLSLSPAQSISTYTYIYNT